MWDFQGTNPRIRLLIESTLFDDFTLNFGDFVKLYLSRKWNNYDKWPFHSFTSHFSRFGFSNPAAISRIFLLVAAAIAHFFENSGFLDKCISMSQPDPATRWRYISATLTKIHCSVKKNTDENGLEMRPLRTWQALNSGSRWSLSTCFKDMQAIWRDFFRFTRFSDNFCRTKKTAVRTVCLSRLH